MTFERIFVLFAVGKAIADSTDIFGIYAGFIGVVKGVFFLRKEPLGCAPPVYTHSENAMERLCARRRE